MIVRIVGARKILQGSTLIVAAVMLLLVLVARPTSAAPSAAPSGTCGGTGTIVCIDPSTQTIGNHTVTTVDIRIDNIPNLANDESLFGADVRLSFNQFILCAQDASNPCPNSSTAVTLTPGPLLTQTDAFCSGGCYSILFNRADNTAGTIEFVIYRLNPAHSISGSGVLATITFYSLGGPSSQLHFTNVQLSNRDGIQIPATTQDGVINVSAPTAVELSYFNADETSSKNGAITLDWKTASETRTAGFNIYRSIHPDGPYARINLQMIPASIDPLLGGIYEYRDTDVAPGQTYYYQLEDVELDGTSTRHKPIATSVSAAHEITPNLLLIISLGAMGSFLFIIVGARLIRHKSRWLLTRS